MKLRNGKYVDCDLLDSYEDRGLSEQEIAGCLGISRMGLWKVRKRLGCFQKVRSDKGKERKSLVERVEGYRRYMREYRGCNPEKFKRNYWKRQDVCKEVLGRLPGRDVHVHHINGKPNDWNHGNMVICDPVYHKFLHKRMLEIG